MATRHVRTWSDERGMVLVFVGMGLLAFLSASALALDVGMFMVARSQAQNAADAGALASAVALVFDDYDDRSVNGPAVQSAIAAATGNMVMGDVVAITASDVTFLDDPLGQPNQIRVDVYRSAAHGNPVMTMVGGYFGVPSADVTASATAEAAPANAATCVLPLTVSDKWLEMQTPAWDPTDTFDAFPSNPSMPPDFYFPASHPAYPSTGYNAQTDRGLQLHIKAGTGINIEPSFYYPWAIPGSSGASDYQANFESCNTTVITFGESMTAEPGNMVGPTKQGIEALVAQDPGAYWDATNERVVSDMHPSPRVRLIPVFDPFFYATGKQEGRNADLKVANFIGVFIEGMQGNSVVARVVPTTGLIDGGAGAAPGGAFPRVIRLVQ